VDCCEKTRSPKLNNMDHLSIMSVLPIGKSDYVSFTFFVGTMAMMAAAVFFFMEVGNTSKEWRTSVLVSGLITFIAAVHYYYMRDYFASQMAAQAADIASGKITLKAAQLAASPTFFRYVDWLLTVPLMCVEFYLITKKAGGKQGLLWKMIFASVVMLVTGYMGEANLGNPTLWGTVSALAYFYIVYEVWMGDVKKLATSAGTAVASANTALGWFVLVGWAIYPLGYLIGTANGQWYQSFANMGLDMNIIYNIGDAVNKIGFGLVIYSLSRKEA
jgi:bacteriorhodopsin